jgi:flavin-binding protein dodecin
MAVARVTEISSTSQKSFEDAVDTGVARANKTLKNVKGAWVKDQEVTIENGQVTLMFGGRGRPNGGGVESPRVWRYRPSLGGPQDALSLSDVVQYPHADAVFSIMPYDPGTGLTVLVGGEFAHSAGNRLVQYAGENSAQPVGPNSLGLNGPVYSLASLQGPVTPGVYLGGGFTSAGGVSASRIARFGCPGAAAPTGFPLLLPAHNAVAQSLSPTFQWAPPGSASPVYYALRIYADAALTQQVYAADNIVGAPDLVIEMPVGFELSASGPDIYRNFVVPTNLTEDKWVRAVEFRPSARKVVHHVLFAYDASGATRKLDGADGRPGFGGMSAIGIARADDAVLLAAADLVVTTLDQVDTAALAQGRLARKS